MKHLIKFTIAIIIMACCNKNVLAAYGTYEQQAEDEMNCAKKYDGFYPNITDTTKLVHCQAGLTYHFQCGQSSSWGRQDFDTSCNCCSWPLETMPEYMKKCNTMSSVGLCDCRDNSNLAKRGPGSCSCNANGVGIDYSGCSDTPPCPEIKDVDGNNRATMKEPWPAGKCYAPKDITFSDASGTFEFTDDCYYSE